MLRIQNQTAVPANMGPRVHMTDEPWHERPARVRNDRNGRSTRPLYLPARVTAYVAVFAATCCTTLHAANDWVIREIPPTDTAGPVQLLARVVGSKQVSTAACEIVSQGTNHWIIARIPEGRTGALDLSIATGKGTTTPLGTYAIQDAGTHDVVIAIDTSGSMKKKAQSGFPN